MVNVLNTTLHFKMIKLVNCMLSILPHEKKNSGPIFHSKSELKHFCEAFANNVPYLPWDVCCYKAFLVFYLQF